MCISQPHMTAPADTTPTMQAATALQLGGQAGIPRGSANLGRLMLRNPGGSASGASSASTSSASSSAAAQPTTPPIAPSASGLTSLALGGSGTTSGGGDSTAGLPTNQPWVGTTNPGLRFAPSTGMTYNKA